MSTAAQLPSSPPTRLHLLLRGLAVLVGLYAFAIAVTLMGSSFKLTGKEAAEGVLEWAQNPILGVLVGVFMTAVVQSSSTVTTMIVTAVAGGLVPLPVAVPMVMGANIGTTVTNTLVAMGSMVRSEEFKRSMQAATVVASPLVAQPASPSKASHAATVLAAFDWARAILPSGSVAQSTGGTFLPSALVASHLSRALVHPAAKRPAALSRNL